MTLFKYITQEFRESRVKLDILFKYNDRPNTYLQAVNNQLKFVNNWEEKQPPQMNQPPKEHYKERQRDYNKYTHLQPEIGDKAVAEPEIKYSKYKNYRIFRGSTLFEDLQGRRKELKDVVACNPDEIHDLLQPGQGCQIHRYTSGRASLRES